MTPTNQKIHERYQMTKRIIPNNKQCTVCEKIKPMLDFHINTADHSGRASACAECTNSKRRTVSGLVKTIYSSQKSLSKSRGHNPPEYSESELLDWIVTEDSFRTLYLAWVGSGYKTRLKPSIDRIKDDYGYVFGNIQLVTWEDNDRKGHKSNCGRKTKRVMQLYKNGDIIKIHSSADDAGIAVNAVATSIRRACKGLQYTCRGYSWKYI